MDSYTQASLRIDYNPNTYMMKVYAWMFIGMMLSAASAFLVLTAPVLMELIFGNKLVFWGLLLFEIILVVGLSGFSKNLPYPVVVLLFALYSITTGLTISIIFLGYTFSSIVSVFLVTAGIFAAMSAYGYFTKRDLSGVGMILYMLLIGMVLAMIVNIFLSSSLVDFVTAVIGVIVFTGLTAYDVQKIRKIGQGSQGFFDLNKLAVLGALALYLDFINLFLSLVRLLGKRR
jgi:FtsH-binding integral membrane protein